MKIELDIKNIEVIADLWGLMHDIYNHPDTPNSVKDMMDIKSRKIMGKNFDVYGEMKMPKKKVKI